MMGESLGTLHIISEVVARIVRVILFFVLWNKFVRLAPKKEKSGMYRIEMLLILLIAEGISIGLMYSGTFPLPTTVSFAIVMGYVVIWRKEDVRETIFSCTLYLNLRFLSYFAVNTLLELISGPIMDAGQRGADIEAFVVKWVDALYLLTNLLYVIMITLLLLPILFMVQRRIRMGWPELGYLSVMNIAGVVLTRTIMSIAVFQTSGAPIILVEENPQLLWQLPLIGFLLYLGEISAIFIWQRYDLYREQSRMYFVENMEKEAIRKRLRETEEYYDRIRKARHEMAGHLMAIKGLADGNHNRELSDYIRNIDSELKPVTLPVSTGNPVTDVIIGDKMRRAREMDTRCVFSFFFDVSWGIQVYDISIVLNNILDNAIEASENLPTEKRHIELRLVERENLIVIRCENKMGSKSETKKKEKDTLWHGIGLRKVEDIAKRYDGAVDIAETKNTFTISIILRKHLFIICCDNKICGKWGTAPFKSGNEYSR